MKCCTFPFYSPSLRHSSVQASVILQAFAPKIILPHPLPQGLSRVQTKSHIFCDLRRDNAVGSTIIMRPLSLDKRRCSIRSHKPACWHGGIASILQHFLQRLHCWTAWAKSQPWQRRWIRQGYSKLYKRCTPSGANKKMIPAILRRDPSRRIISIRCAAVRNPPYSGLNKSTRVRTKYS